MIYKVLIILVFGCVFRGHSQNTKDVGFLKDLNGVNFDCDSTSGTMIESKICTNIELRKIDSIMLSKFNRFLKKIKNDSLLSKNDSLVNVFKKQQIQWEIKRKSNSLYMTDGWRAHTEGIVYMQSMIFFTELRIREIEYMEAICYVK